MHEYTEGFYSLFARNDIIVTKEQTVARYIAGFQLQIQDELSLLLLKDKYKLQSSLEN